MIAVLYDTNVLLDVLLDREPFVAMSAAAVDVAGRARARGYVAGHAVTTLAYLLQRQMGRSDSRSTLARLLSKLLVAPITDAGIRQALVGPFSDFEDAVTQAAAVEIGASFIVTRNVKDFRRSTISAVLPEVFLTAV